MPNHKTDLLAEVAENYILCECGGDLILYRALMSLQRVWARK
jgi:hypothetical protein